MKRMNWNFSQLLHSLNDNPSILMSGKWGLEKESLRVKHDGDLATTPHPEVFGDKLTNPHITTDFSESQLELITSPASSIEGAFNSLINIQGYVEKNLKDEILWPLSMPAKLPHEDEIPIARYGKSKKGIENEVYRKGLALRYGKKVQLISGIHYNFSFGDGFWNFLQQNLNDNSDKCEFKNNIYLSVVRNYLRYRWLLLYLFGASPAVDESFDENIIKKLKNFSKDKHSSFDKTYYSDYITSLRMSPYGYVNNKQNEYLISYNNLKDYIKDIKKLLTTRSEEYSKFGIFDDSEQLQLNDMVLQKESEYYSSIRLKQKPSDKFSLIDSLDKFGINYIEVRTFDLNPFSRTGVTLEQLYFMHLFLLFCLLENSPYITDEEMKIANKNESLVALYGKNCQLKLFKNKRNKILLNDWASGIFSKMKSIAQLLDRTRKDPVFENSLNLQIYKTGHPENLPSSMILSEMKKNNENIVEFGLRKFKENLHGD